MLNCSAPDTTFPKDNPDDLTLCLINSDSSECNRNLSTYLKAVVDTMGYKDKESYHKLSVYAMRLLTSNLFVKNYRLCIGKLLSMVQVFTDLKNYEVGEVSPESEEKVAEEKMAEFICILLYLLLKVKNSQQDFEKESDVKDFNDCVDTEVLFDTLKNFQLITLIANFISSHISHGASFVLLKFCCDIIFEYFFHVELLSDQEFENLVNTPLISVLIDDVLENNSDYDINDDWENEDQLIAYEEFKLLLLINEQYLMKSYSCNVRNKVFDGLMTQEADSDSLGDSVNYKISGFMNLLVFHLNREESQIIKILILKFLYLVFTSSYTSKLYYLNDLKILVDIFVRELNDLPYMGVDKNNQILIITYLKVLYPMMMFSQLCDLTDCYKRDELNEMLHNFIDTSIEKSNDPQLKLISDLANRCLTVSWLKKKKLYNHNNKSASSLTSNTSQNQPPDYHRSNSSSDSLAHSFTRVASVRSISRNDYYLHTTVHNNPDENNNTFLKAMNNLNLKESRQSNILDLPNEYLGSRLAQKALRKPAPPPPPPPKSPNYSPTPSFRKAQSLPPTPIQRALLESRPETSRPLSPAPPPPPPPRRRR